MWPFFLRKSHYFLYDVFRSGHVKIFISEIFLNWKIMFTEPFLISGRETQKLLLLYIFQIKSLNRTHWVTRMHSSIMRTARCSGRLSSHVAPSPAMHEIPHQVWQVQNINISTNLVLMPHCFSCGILKRRSRLKLVPYIHINDTNHYSNGKGSYTNVFCFHWFFLF